MTDHPPPVASPPNTGWECTIAHLDKLNASGGVPIGVAQFTNTPVVASLYTQYKM